MYIQVSGIIFNLLNQNQMEKLSQSQAKIKTLAHKLRHHKAFADWDYGQMCTLRSWQPPRGQPRDSYVSYPASEILTLEDIHTLFTHTSVSLCLPHPGQLPSPAKYPVGHQVLAGILYLEPHAPLVVKELKQLGKQANILGHYGVTIYHWWNYIAAEHFDKDATSTVSYQLKKRDCNDAKFNFSFSEWEKVLETRENCIWWVSLYAPLPVYLCWFGAGDSNVTNYIAQWPLMFYFA